MGAWGAGPFENDTASDWAASLKGVASLRTALTEAVSESGLDDDVMSVGIAAVGVVAACVERRAVGIEAVDRLIDQNIEMDALVELALVALDNATADGSLLASMWQESGAFDEWQAVLESLRSRLTTPVVFDPDEIVFEQPTDADLVSFEAQRMFGARNNPKWKLLPAKRRYELSKQTYQPGSVFAVPLTEDCGATRPGLWGVGLVQSCNWLDIEIVYLFKSFWDRLPTIDDVVDVVVPENAFEAWDSLLPLHIGLYPVIGQVAGYNIDKWPLVVNQDEGKMRRGGFTTEGALSKVQLRPRKTLAVETPLPQWKRPVDIDVLWLPYRHGTSLTPTKRLSELQGGNRQGTTNVAWVQNWGRPEDL